MPDPKAPILIELEEEGGNPADAAPIDDLPQGEAMQRAVRLAGRPPSALVRLFWVAATGFLTIVLSVAAWDFVMGLLTRVPVLGAVAGVLLVLLGLAALGVALREVAAFARLARLDGLRQGVEAALISGDLAAARVLARRLSQLYAGRGELVAARDRLSAREDDLFDVPALFDLAEAELMAPLDTLARAEVEAAARQVAAVTAFVPLALADVIAALVANLRMIRRIAEIYGGRAGTLGAWRLTRSVMAHLVATGAVAMGDDLVGTAAGGGILSRLSRRFGEGLVNGALTARVGVAAIEVCRPLPFRALPRPRTAALVSRALTGLFGSAGR
ncbi:YcjF family protein [Halodurantibacterium flavum]|uniref:YcjF family protein n=1 Tax=Halodurantibacterium flavum TaxID=1382802 RepID=A0ABW4S206_9RHOB